MGAPALKRYVVFTKSSRIVGIGEEKLLLGITTGCTVDNARVGLPDYLSFYGKPYGDVVAVRDFVRSGSQGFRVIADNLFMSYILPKDEIIFIHDLAPMHLSTQMTPEKNQIERNFALENVFVKINEFGITIKGQTYLNKQSLDSGIIRPSLRDGEWFLLQHPEFIDDAGRQFDDVVELSAIGEKMGFVIDHLLISVSKVSLGV